MELTEHELVTVRPCEPWQRTQIDQRFNLSSGLSRSESTNSFTSDTGRYNNSKSSHEFVHLIVIIPITAHTEPVFNPVPFIAVENLNPSSSSLSKVKPVWLKYGDNVLPTSNVAFEMKKVRNSIGESYLLTNPIFSSSSEEVDILLERNGSSKSGFLFGVKSELDSTEKVVFAREMETSPLRPLTCMIDFTSSTKHGRCLIPDATFDHFIKSYSVYAGKCVRLRLLKRGDNIFVNFNFVTEVKHDLGYHLDAHNEAWFLFCRLKTAGRIVIELGSEFRGGSIGSKPSQRKRSVLETSQICPNVNRALEFLPKSVTPITINECRTKCYCSSCYQSSSNGTDQKHRKGKTVMNLLF